MLSEYKSNLTFEVTDGPKTALKDQAKVDAYDRCDVELRSGETRKVELQPTSDITRLRFLIIWRSAPPTNLDQPELKKVCYMMNDAAPWIPLENQHVIMGSGVFNLLKSAPLSLTFKNNQQSTVTVTVVVGRDTVKAQADPNPCGSSTSGQPDDCGKKKEEEKPKCEEKPEEKPKEEKPCDDDQDKPDQTGESGGSKGDKEQQGSYRSGE